MIDLITLSVKAGDGGKGCVAWRHEKYYPNGGPFGGDGGNGGDVFFAVDTNETTLGKLRFTKKIKAGDGAPGMTKKMHGKAGDDVIVHVPLGTLIRNAANNDLLADLTSPHQKVLIAHGGKGGLGNYHFATARNDTPEFAQPGQIGESLDLILELRLLADAGLVGFPSVGKSTFLSVVSAARPAIADYEFTTLEPNIGVVYLPDGRSFVLGDMPGLIEGAKDGRGLGLAFLRHIKRCRCLLHMIDMSGFQRNPISDYEVINKELSGYDRDLSSKPQIVIANKMDDEYAPLHLEEFKKAYPDLKVYEISALEHRGIEKVLYDVMALIEKERQTEKTADEEAAVVYRYEPKQPLFKIVNMGGGHWKVESVKIERMVRNVDFAKREETYAFARTLEKLGVDQALYEAGARDGDQVILGEYIMDYKE